jgi:hypothetical protein
VVVRRLRFAAAQLGPKPGRRAALAQLIDTADLPGPGWERMDERTWRAGKADRDAIWARHARQAGSIACWRSFTQRRRRWLWAQAIVLPSAEDARAAFDTIPEAGLSNLRARVTVVAEHDVPAPVIAGASIAVARQQLTDGPGGAGRVLLLSLLRDRALALITGSGPDGGWDWSELAAIAGTQAKRFRL